MTLNLAFFYFYKVIPFIFNVLNILPLYYLTTKIYNYYEYTCISTTMLFLFLQKHRCCNTHLHFTQNKLVFLYLGY